MHVQGRICTVAAAPGILQKLGRVLKEKATGDFDRVFKGTEKTREKLGVRRPACCGNAELAGRSDAFSRPYHEASIDTTLCFGCQASP